MDPLMNKVYINIPFSWKSNSVDHSLELEWDALEDNVIGIPIFTQKQGRYKVNPEVHSRGVLGPVIMMTSSNGNIFRVSGSLCREFTGHRWIPCTKASAVGDWTWLLKIPFGPWKIRQFRLKLSVGGYFPMFFWNTLQYHLTISTRFYYIIQTHAIYRGVWIL